MINGDELREVLEEQANRIADLEAQMDALLTLLGQYINLADEEEEEEEESWIDAALDVEDRTAPIVD